MWRKDRKWCSSLFLTWCCGQTTCCYTSLYERCQCSWQCIWNRDYRFKNIVVQLGKGDIFGLFLLQTAIGCCRALGVWIVSKFRFLLSESLSLPWHWNWCSDMLIKTVILILVYFCLCLSVRVIIIRRRHISVNCRNIRQPDLQFVINCSQADIWRSPNSHKSAW